MNGTREKDGQRIGAEGGRSGTRTGWGESKRAMTMEGGGVIERGERERERGC